MTGQWTRSQIWLVDLAGSERLAKTEVEGERLDESQFIIKSHSALGDVTFALAFKNSHIPYRNSKLTHLLQSSLGGDCNSYVRLVQALQITPRSGDDRPSSPTRDSRACRPSCLSREGQQDDIELWNASIVTVLSNAREVFCA